MLNRLRCRLLGCDSDQSYCGCDRCGAELYDPAFIDRGWLVPLLSLGWRARNWCWPRCWQCGRRLWPWRRWAETFCSPECQESFVPF